MNLTELIATTVGIIGSIGGIGLGDKTNWAPRAPTFDALEKVTNSGRSTGKAQQMAKDVVIEQLYQVIDQKTQVALDNQTKIDKLTREWQERL